MFGALNRFISRLDSDPQYQDRNAPGAFGFQVLKNTNTELALEPWFDFIIGINGRNIDNPDPALFATEIRNCAGSSVNLGLWSAKGQRVRSIYATVPSDASSLGLSLQWMPVTSAEDIWHILDVSPNSPADLAGLLPYGDYIIGSPEGLVKGESGLGELVEHFLGQPLRLHVYNHEYNVTRLLTIEPSRTWGGSGALGCVLGFGALHRIPAPLDEPPQAPGETLFDPSAEHGAAPPAAPARTATPQYLVPADMIPSTTSSLSPGAPNGSAPPAGTRKARTHHAPAATDMDAYFAEGEAQSREADHSPSRPPAGSLAPPPKGGPPRAASPLREEAKTEDEDKT